MVTNMNMQWEGWGIKSGLQNWVVCFGFSWIGKKGWGLLAVVWAEKWVVGEGFVGFGTQAWGTWGGGPGKCGGK